MLSCIPSSFVCTSANSQGKNGYLVNLFIFSSIYFFYKPFILYYKIEELKMLFAELNIRLQE